MVVSSLDQLGRYKALSKNFADAIAWIEAGSWRSLGDGRHDVGGAAFFAQLMRFETKPLAGCDYETHQRYADIQILVEGEEYVMVRPVAGMDVKTPYEADRDIQFFEGGKSAPEHRVALEPGVAAFFFPEDAHKPCVARSAPVKVRKLVVKVLVS